MNINKLQSEDAFTYLIIGWENEAVEGPTSDIRVSETTFLLQESRVGQQELASQCLQAHHLPALPKE